MHLKREVDQNASGQRDVRLRHYYIYQCSICNHEKEYDHQPNFDLLRLRKCPNCGVTNDTNMEETLIKRKHELEQHIKQLSEELSQVTDQLYEVQGANHGSTFLLPEPTDPCTA